MWLFKRKTEEKREEVKSIWKEDYSDCVTLDYLPEYSICKCATRRNCRHLAMYAGMMLCSNPSHKSFIEEGSEPFDPHKGRFF